MLGQCKNKQHATFNQETLPPLSYTIIDEGTQALAYEQETFRLLSDEKEFQNVWDSIHLSLLGKKPPMPSVDFSQYTVVFYAMGPRYRGGQQLRLEEINEISSTLRFHIKIIELSPECPAADVLTHHYLLLKVNRKKFNTELNKKVIIQECK